MIFAANSALAVDTTQPAQSAAAAKDINPLEIINKINKTPQNQIQNKSNLNVTYDNRMASLPNGNCYDAFGIFFIPYNNKVYIWRVEKNSIAYRNGIRVGDEIVKINDEKTKTMNDNQILRKFDNNSIQLEIKSNDNQKRVVQLSKSRVCFPVKNIDAKFEAYFSQIYPEAEYLDDNLEMCEGLLTARLSGAAKQDVKNKQNNLIYWHNKRTKFRNGYNLCMSSEDTSNISNCINQLLNREQTQINYEQQMAQQQAQFEAQQQLYREQMAQQQAIAIQQSIQAEEAAKAARDYQNQQVLLNSIQNNPFRQQPKYRLYDSYGRSYGYVQQSNW